MSETYIDYRWYGAPNVVADAVVNLPNVIGPRELDGIAYVTVRSAVPLDLPAGLAEFGPNLSTVLVGVWAGEASPVPKSVTNFQARAALMQLPGSAEGRSLFQDVDDALRALGGVSWQAWEQANDFTRDGVLVKSMAAQFGLADEQLDALFRTASLIEA